MSNSRVREFETIRSQKLSDNSSQISKSSAFNGTKSNQSFNRSFNQSFNTSFLKKDKPDVCIGCTNKDLAS